MKASRLLVLVAIVMFLAASCAPSPSRAVLGKWEKVGGTEVVQFTSDGKVKFVDEENGTVMVGSYKFVGDHELELCLGGSAGVLTGAVPIEARVEDNVLTLSTQDGVEIKYERKVG